MGLVEVLLALATGAIALMAHAAGVLRSHNLGRAEESRTLAIQALRGLVERMRDDEDWTGLYARLGALLDTAGGWHPISDLYADLPPTMGLGEVTVRIEIPRGAAADPTAQPGLHFREDVADPTFALPYDVNGDGVVTSEVADANYVILPVVVRLRWRAGSEVPQEMRLSTWLTGERP